MESNRHTFVTYGNRCSSPWLCASCGETEGSAIHTGPWLGERFKGGTIKHVYRPLSTGELRVTVLHLDNSLTIEKYRDSWVA